jgi:hypothetical protein
MGIICSIVLIVILYHLHSTHNRRSLKISVISLHWMKKVLSYMKAHIQHDTAEVTALYMPEAKGNQAQLKSHTGKIISQQMTYTCITILLNRAQMICFKIFKYCRSPSYFWLRIHCILLGIVNVCNIIWGGGKCFVNNYLVMLNATDLPTSTQEKALHYCYLKPKLLVLLLVAKGKHGVTLLAHIFTMRWCMSVYVSKKYVHQISECQWCIHMIHSFLGAILSGVLKTFDKL